MMKKMMQKITMFGKGKAYNTSSTGYGTAYLYKNKIIYSSLSDGVSSLSIFIISMELLIIIATLSKREVAFIFILSSKKALHRTFLNFYNSILG